MLKTFASMALASLVVLQSGAALAETRVFINGQDGVFVSDGRGDFGRERGDRGRDGWHGHRPPPPRVVVRERHDDYAVGIMGFLGGMAVGSALDNGGRIPVVRYPRERYEPRPVALRPWSPGWYRWCEAKYRSFDPRSGTYVGFDGRARFCEVR